MEKPIKTVALLIAAMSTVIFGCQKETFTESSVTVGQTLSVRVVSYTVDGIAHSARLVGDDTWANFLNRMLALAEEGHTVSFRNESAASSAASTKEQVTFTTQNKDEAYAWAEEMVDEGYDVTIIYDKKTGIYTCIAVK